MNARIKHQSILLYILNFTEVMGYAPTVRQIADFMGMSVSGTYAHLRLAIKAEELTQAAPGQGRTWTLTPVGRERARGNASPPRSE